MYRALSLFGPNILTAESDEWKRHRRIAAPSFSERNNRLVYEDTTRITMELFEHWSAGQKGVVKVDDAVTFTSKLALMAISAAGGSLVQYPVIPVSHVRVRIWLSVRMGRNGTGT